MDRLVDYFAVVGLDPDSVNSIPKSLKRDKLHDIVEISVIRSPDEKLPIGWDVFTKTTSGQPANIDRRNVLSYGQKELFICTRRRQWNELTKGIVDIRIVKSAKSTDIPPNYEIVAKTIGGIDANFGTEKHPCYFVYKREFEGRKPDLDEEPIIQVKRNNVT